MNEITAEHQRSFPIFLGTLFLLLVVISYQISDPATGRSVLAAVTFRLFSPIQSLFAAAANGVVDTVQNYFFLVNTNRDNVRLQQEISHLKIQMRIAGELRQENDRLRKILQLSEKFPYQLLSGEVIARDAKAAQSRMLFVNRGTRHGIETLMPVVTPEGVVGMTVMVDVFSSNVLMITDASASIGAMLEKGRIAGILSGKGGASCILCFLPLSLEVKSGDLVVTSGQEGIFPENLPIGRVIREISESPDYRCAEVKPFPNFTSVSEVVFLKLESGGSTK